MSTDTGLRRLNNEQGLALVDLASQTIAKELGLEPEPSGDSTLRNRLADPVYENKSGVFVTIHKGQKLRGCIGSLSGRGSVKSETAENARQAAFNDHRFPPLSPEEFEHIEIEVSVLTSPLPLEYESADQLLRLLRPGIDGVTIHRGQKSATFLPQVWSQLPDPALFLSQLCRKAGLPENAWQQKDFEVEIYQVQSFK